MKIGIMGLGWVGGALKEVFQTKYGIMGYDPAKEDYKDSSVLKDVEIIFICVPTPMKESWEVDISYVFSACKSIKDINPNAIVCIKSTIPPGTSDMLEKEFNLKIGCSPEFLREKYAIEDILASKRFVIGGIKEVREKIKEVYKTFVPNAIYKELTNKEAEMVKYTSNALLSSQIGFANEIYNICGVLDIDYNKIRETLLLDKRHGTYTEVPGEDGKLGFGGHCFPKDLRGLIFHAKQKGYNPSLFNELWSFNKKQRK